MTFHDTQFPTDISYGSSGGPEYNTDIIITAGGHEQRNINWAQARARYNVAHGVKSQSQLDTLIAFFRARKGRAHGFRFKDWSDHSAAGQVIGTGDGSTTAFQLVKNYVNGSVAESRFISKPIASTVYIYLDDTLHSGWSVDDSTGIITFTNAPSADVIIKADFTFDVPVRFDTDRLSTTLEDYGVHSWLDIPLIELRV